MEKTVANVLVGVASLAIRQPNDALAEWASDQYYAGSHSVKLSKKGSGNAGSTHLQLTPPTGITLNTFCTNAAAGGAKKYSFWHKCQNGVTGNYAQFEFRFEDPDSNAWLEFTIVPQQGKVGNGIWAEEDLSAETPKGGYGGVGELGGSFFEWGTLIAIADAATTIAEAQENVGECGSWILTRVRIELWEPEPARYMHIDSVTIDGVAYEIEPGATTATGLSLSSPYTDVGYTEDGVTFNYTVDTADIDVEEESFSVDRRITKETIEIVCNMAESSLFNIDKAIAGSVLSGNILTIGAGVLKEMSIKLTGINPAGFTRSYEFPRVTATGSVGMSYRKGAKTVVPVTFQALKPSSGPVGTFVDNAA